LRLAVIQLKGNIDAFVQFGDLTPSEYSRATIYISLACGMSLLGIILAGKSIRPNSAAKLTYDSRIAFNLLLILAFVQVTQLLYLYYLTPVLNLISTYRPGDILEKVLAYFRSEFFVMGLFAVAMLVVRPFEPKGRQRWRNLWVVERRLLLVI